MSQDQFFDEQDLPVGVEPSTDKIHGEVATVKVVALMRAVRHSVFKWKKLVMKAWFHVIALLARPGNLIRREMAQLTLKMQFGAEVIGRFSTTSVDLVILLALLRYDSSLEEPLVKISQRLICSIYESYKNFEKLNSSYQEMLK